MRFYNDVIEEVLVWVLILIFVVVLFVVLFSFLVQAEKSGVDNDGADLCGFLTIVGHGVTGTCGADRDIAGAEGTGGTVIAIKHIAFYNVVQLAFILMYMETDAAAGSKGHVGKHAALIVHFFCGHEMGDFYNAVATTHLFVEYFSAVCCFSDHMNDPLI